MHVADTHLPECFWSTVGYWYRMEKAIETGARNTGKEVASANKEPVSKKTHRMKMKMMSLMKVKA